MTSNRDRRAAARARLERDMAARAAAARRRHRRQTIIAAALAGVVLVGGIVWVVIATSDDDAKPGANASTLPTPSASVDTGCAWRPLVDPSPASGSPEPMPSGATNVGTPQKDVPRTGTQVITFDTSQGVIKVEMDLSKVPCTAASLAYLASKGFYTNTKCHRLVAGIGALQCGDPKGDGSGGPTYRVDDENLPVGRRPTYLRGVMAMANSGPNTNGSQFFFVYKDNELPAQYTIVGKVTTGMDVIDKVAAGGDDGAFEQQAGGGHPKIEVVLKSVTVGTT